MKKLILILLIFTLCGCGEKNSIEEKDKPVIDVKKEKDDNVPYAEKDEEEIKEEKKEIDNSLKIGNYIGKNYKAAKNELENLGFKVNIEKKSIDDSDKYMIVISQNPEPNNEVNEGDTITLYIPKKVTYMPDFTNGQYTEDDVKEFCEDNDIPTYLTSNDYTSDVEVGTIVKQYPEAGTRIGDGINTIILTIRTNYN